MNDSPKPIFAKNDENDENNNNENNRVVFSYDDIIKSMPTNTVNKPDINLSKTLTERRWRFFKYGDRKLIEISKKEPMKERLYIDILGNWIQFDVPKIWDTYLVLEKYCYV